MNFVFKNLRQAHHDLLLLVANLNVANMSFNVIRENKIFTKISGFTLTPIALTRIVPGCLAVCEDVSHGNLKDQCVGQGSVHITEF